MQLRLIKEKEFYKKMLTIAVPIAIQNLITTSLNMIDTVMIGKLGETQIAAVGLANQLFFIFMIFLFSVNSGAGIFIAQFWGKKDIKNIRRVLGIALILGGVCSLFFFLCGFLIPEKVLKIFSQNDKKVIILGSQYLRIVSFSYLVNNISIAYGYGYRNIGQPKLPMIISGISIILNTFLNYIFIFGKLGFSPMGIEGAAIATLISRIFECFLIVYVIYSKNHILAAKIKEMLDISREIFNKYFRTSIHIIVDEGLWSLGITFCSIAYARIGTEAFAAFQISNTIQEIFMVVAIGIGNACAVMVGNNLGNKNFKKAEHYAKKFCIVGPILGLLIGSILFLISNFIVNIFSVSHDVSIQAVRTLKVMSLFVWIRIYNTVMIIGILRSGGDTKFTLFLETGTIWLVGVPLAFIGAFYFKLPIYLVVMLVSLEEVIKAILGTPRLISKKWVCNIVERI
ncbi:MATE family efflux transporter [Haloimpatiens sp. FM7330]|uniref:MATE family efflux transporter n=1 Tax=Haloimpatiens sp. FM7330 TaxID=3298610 RepID=UPI003626835E